LGLYNLLFREPALAFHPPRSLSEFVRRLRDRGELAEITAQVNPTLELAEIHRQVIAQSGPALLFKNVLGSKFSVATNLFSSKKRLQIALGDDYEDVVGNLIESIIGEGSFPFFGLWKKRALLRIGTKRVLRTPVAKHSLSPDLSQIPFLTCWPGDGGAFLTLPLVYTESPSGRGANLGMYRIQRFDATTAGLHWQIGKGGGFHFSESEALGRDLPVTIFLGGSPALILSAIAPLPENVSELLFASILQGSKVGLSRPNTEPLPLIAACDAALVGCARAFERRLEGPFGDHYGYQNPALPFPVFHCTKIYHASDAIIPATVVGKPPQEDSWIGQYLERLFAPILRLCIPALKDLHTYPETGFHPLAVARIQERYEKEALSTSLRLLGEGQLALTKILLVTDQPVRVDNIKEVLPAVLERLRPAEDIHVFAYTALDTLDMTGPAPNRGSKALFIATGDPRRRLPTHLSSPLPLGIRHAIPFTPGCLIADGLPYADMPDPSGLLDGFSGWPLVFLVDDAVACASSDAEFLWQAFTRFEPGRDLYTKDRCLRRNGVSFTFPIMIDARTKPTYPRPAAADSATVDLVTRRWHEYFPVSKKR
jgi:4-hydroxybenzoate decarboxylase subunit C